MASISQISQVPCRAVPVNHSRPQFSPRSSIVSFSLIGCAAKSSFHGAGLGSARPMFRLRAAGDEELEPAKKDIAGEGSAVAVAEETTEVAAEPKVLTEMDKLKKALVDSFYGTERGLRVTGETRSEIVELVTNLESKNPTPAPTEALPILNGKWILVYTSFAGLFPLLSSGLLPLVEVEEISQTIDSESLNVQNSVRFSGPLATASISTNAKFEVQSPKGMQIKFDEGVIGTPQLTDSLVFPEKVEVLGQNIDLSPLKGILTSVQDTASSVAETISSQPDLKFPISNDSAQSWLITTYLDEDLRISRGDDGSIFVFIKEGSFLSNS